MKHKFLRTLLITCVLITSLFSGGAVFADEEELTDPGITPDSPFYFLDGMSKGLGMFFTFGNEAKVKKALKYGEERLAEAEAMGKKDRIREMERAANDYEGYMEMVRERLENGGISDNLTERVCLATSNHLAVLERVRQRVRGHAGEAIANAENASVNGQISALRALSQNRFQRAVELTSDAAENYMERTRARMSGYLSSGNNTDDIQVLLDIAARITALEDELVAKAEELGIDVTPLLERLAHSTANRIQVLNDVYENAPESARHGIENALENSVRKYERSVERLRARNDWSANETGEESHSANVKAQNQNRVRVETQNRERAGAAVEGNGQSPGQQQNHGQGNNGKSGK